MTFEQPPKPLATSATYFPGFPPLDLETRTHVETECAAYHLNRKSQTLRSWACLQPKGCIRPIRVNGRLAWPVSAIKAALSGEPVL